MITIHSGSDRKPSTPWLGPSSLASQEALRLAFPASLDLQSSTGRETISLMAISVPVAENATPSTPHTRDIRSTRLPNGLLVLTERMPHLRSVSMGVWLDAGSRDETPALNGISHFLEHMVFKGTTTRSAQQFAREADALGGNVDAFTGKETVCFSIKVLDENVPAALDLLTDLVLHPTFAPEDIVREQGVILEEIKMDEDNPDYLVHELFTRNFWPHDALGRSDPRNREDGLELQPAARARRVCAALYAGEHDLRRRRQSAARRVPRAG